MIVIAILAEGFNILMLLAVIVVEILFGIACKQLMKLKGSDNSYLWFVIGFVLSFIGVIISMLMPDKSPPQPEPPAFAEFSAPPYQQPYEPQPVYNNPQDIRCTSCGMLNPNDAKYCIQCGTRF